MRKLIIATCLVLSATVAGAEGYSPTVLLTDCESDNQVTFCLGYLLAVHSTAEVFVEGATCSPVSAEALRLSFIKGIRAHPILLTKTTPAAALGTFLLEGLCTYEDPDPEVKG